MQLNAGAKAEVILAIISRTTKYLHMTYNRNLFRKPPFLPKMRSETVPQLRLDVRLSGPRIVIVRPSVP